MGPQNEGIRRDSLLITSSYVAPDYGREGWPHRLQLSQEVGVALEQAPTWSGTVACYADRYDSEGIIEWGNVEQAKPWVACSSVLDLTLLLFFGVTTEKEGLLISSATFDTFRRNDEYRSASIIQLDLDEGTRGDICSHIGEVIDLFGDVFVMGYVPLSHSDHPRQAA